MGRGGHRLLHLLHPQAGHGNVISAPVSAVVPHMSKSRLKEKKNPNELKLSQDPSLTKY